MTSNIIVVDESGPPHAPTCVPDNGTVFPLGDTDVTCTAKDDVGNVGSTTFTVHITSNDPPRIVARDLTAEAESSAGAIVNYQVSATGFIADCSPPGSTEVVPCTTWRSASDGLGFAPQAVAADPVSGAIYTGFFGTATPTPTDDVPLVHHMLRSTNGGTSWTELANLELLGPGAGGIKQIVVGGGIGAHHLRRPGRRSRSRHPGEPRRRVVVGNRAGRHGHLGHCDRSRGFRAPDCLADRVPVLHAAARRAATRPLRNPRRLRQLDRRQRRAPRPTGARGGDGPRECEPDVPERPAARLRSRPDQALSPHRRRRVGAGRHPHVPFGAKQRARAISVSPVTPSGQSFPTVFAARIVSRDGGQTWIDNPYGFDFRAVVFDRANPATIVDAAGSLNNMFKSVNGGRDWLGATTSAPIVDSFVQDRFDANTFYTASNLGLFKRDATNFWTPISAGGFSLPGARIRDVAVDPVDPRIAYLATNVGVFRSDPLDSTRWVAANRGITDPLAFQGVGQVVVDRFNRNIVYLGGRIGFSDFAWKSPGPGLDGLPTWTGLTYTVNQPPNPPFQAQATGRLTLDPLQPGNWVSLSETNASNDYFFLQDSDLGPLPGNVPVQLNPVDLSGWHALPPTGNRSPFAYRLQMLPSTEGTSLLTSFAILAGGNAGTSSVGGHDVRPVRRGACHHAGRDTAARQVARPRRLEPDRRYIRWPHPALRGGATMAALRPSSIAGRSRTCAPTRLRPRAGKSWAATTPSRRRDSPPCSSIRSAAADAWSRSATGTRSGRATTAAGTGRRTTARPFT